MKEIETKTLCRVHEVPLIMLLSDDDKYEGDYCPLCDAESREDCE